MNTDPVRWMAAIMALAALPLAGSAASASAPGKLIVRVSGFRSDKGQLLVRLYGNETGFPTDGSHAVRQLSRPIKDGHAAVELTNLPFGSYALACVHDENGNNKLDTNLLGIPKEGVCASNDARGHHGPPRWSDARFDFKADGTVLEIHVQY